LPEKRRKRIQTDRRYRWLCRLTRGEKGGERMAFRKIPDKPIEKETREGKIKVTHQTKKGGRGVRRSWEQGLVL